MNIALLGLPGTGKGTLGQAITQNSATDQALGGRWIEFDAGTALREYAYAGDEPTQRELRQLLEAGQMAPTPLMMRFYREWISSRRESGLNILSSGIPRGDQTDYFLADIKDGAYPCEGLIWLSAPEDLLVRRLAGRRTCSSSDCGAIYNVETAPPAQENVCDECGAQLLVRAEDADEYTMRVRIANNAAKLANVRDQFIDAGIPVREIDASGEPERVYQEARTIIRRLSQRRRHFVGR